MEGMQSVVKTYDSASIDEQRKIKISTEESKDKNHDYKEPENDEDNDIMSHLNYRKLQKIKEDFRKCEEDGLTMEQFIKVMLIHLPDSRDKVGLVKNLIELFRQIDVNNDETLEWDEFTGHIIELGMVRKDRTFIDAIKTYFTSEIRDDEKHDTEIESMFYIDKLKHLLVMERDSKRFKVYDSRTGKYMQNVPKSDSQFQYPSNTVNLGHAGCNQQIQNKGGAVIAADYVEFGNTKYVATTSNDNNIYFWDSNNYLFRESISTSEIQMCIKWCGGDFQRLFTGGCDAQIHAFDVKEMKEISFNTTRKEDDKEKVDVKHTETILDLLPIPEMQRIASASMDTNMCIWDMNTMQGKSIHTDHQSGIYSLEWFPDQSLILSAGFDHDIYIWNPIVTDKIFQLKGHNHSLVGVKWLKGTNQVVSADISGMFKVWDVRTFTPVQTFNCPLNEINCFAVTTPPKRIVAGGRKLVFYDYDEPTDNHLADDQACLSVLYNPVFYTFITAHPKCIKTWDATTGALQSVFRDLTPKEITSICLDERKRKLFVGDSRGRMFSINIKNGAKMKKFKKGEKSKNKDKDDISGMYYWGGNCGLLAASWDGNVRLYDDSDASEEGTKKYTMDKHKDSVNNLDFRLADDLCASCGDDGYIYVFNFQSYRQECSLKFQNQDMLPLAPVKIVKFLEGTDILVAADLDGFIHFYCVTATPNPRKNSHLCKIQDHSIADIGDLSKPPHFPIRAMDFDKEEGMLYTGDEMGYLIKWDINTLIDKLGAITPKAAGDEGDLMAAQGEGGKKIQSGKAAFITDMENGEKIEFLDSDIVQVLRYRAHQDLINQVTFVPECGSGIIATCSFDCNVYMWSKNIKNKGDEENPRLAFEKVGSLVLGTGAAQEGEQSEAEIRKYANIWRIKIDKNSRFVKDREEAEDLLDKASHMDYETMFKKQKENTLKIDTVKPEEAKQQIQPKKMKDDLDDAGPEQTDHQILEALNK